MDKTLDKQVAIVTGASRGIGRAIALELARLGATVIGTATSESGAAAITAAFAEAGVTGRGAVLNVNDAAAAEALIDATVKEFGALNVLVNNAGITQDQLAMRMKDEDWDAVIDTNLKSVFRLSRAVLRPMMKARGGRIINITSVVGSAGNPGQVNYAAAKAGVAGMTRALAREIGSRGITVNCVAPGFIDNRHDEDAAGRTAGRAQDPDSARPTRQPGGHRPCRRVPRIAAGRLHHRHDAAREWRHVHVVTVFVYHPRRIPFFRRTGA